MRELCTRLVLLVVFLMIATAATEAKAECLEVGWRLKGQRWTYNRAVIHNRGKILVITAGDAVIDLKVSDERGHQPGWIVFRGTWRSTKVNREWGIIRLEMNPNRTRARARGWYSHNKARDPNSRGDFVIQECR